ncbi:MAG TPA: Ig-like domain-containing protein, partial [Longimicrobiales bacterium]|nr:Ig-like domain-containing protein [Longimicrobiales bacterium]
MGPATRRDPGRPGIGPGAPGDGRSPRTALAGLLTAGVGVAMAALGSCARQGAPPGGPPDRRPPYVLSTRPDTFAVVEPFRDPVVFRFSERISEQPSSGTLADAAVVSPATSQVRVEHSREAIEVSLLGGFRAGRVYRVTLRPVIRDMFGNLLQRPFELVFSTGGEFHPNTVAGLVEDRITGEGVSGARVDATPTAGEGAGDTITYTARTDEDGIFALRYLPPGEYVVTAFEDRNRD